MSVVRIIDTLTDWAREDICNEIQLKVPPDNDEAMDSGYEYRLANPTAFPMYIPSEDKLPSDILSAHPCLCVRFFSAQDDMASKTGAMDVQFVFCVWDPGLHSQDLFLPNGDGTFKRQTAASVQFERNGSGWRDVWNFVDLAVRKLTSVNSVGSCIIDKNTPFEYGPVKVDGAIADYYPYWYAELTFRVTYPLLRYNEELENNL